MTADLHEEFERQYERMWPIDRNPFKRPFTGSPVYFLEKVQAAFEAYPETRKALAEYERAKRAVEHSVWRRDMSGRPL